MRKNRLMDPDLELWNFLENTRHAIFKARTKELHQHNISPMQAFVFFVIHALEALGKEATPAEISRWLFREPSSVSDLLGRMEKEGLVSKVRGLDKKNMVGIELTEKGRQAYCQADKLQSIHKIMSSLSEEERQQLRASLDKLWNKALVELGMERRLPFPLSLQVVPFEHGDSGRK